MRETYIDTQHGKLFCSIYGEGKKGVPLLVLHGGPGFLSMPQVVSELADERPVYFYDQLGCGKSDRAEDKSLYSAGHYINELEEVRSRLGLDDFFLMGFSWGAMLACAFMLDRKPKGIRGLLLCAPCLGTPSWEADQRENIAHMPDEVREAIEAGESSGQYGEKYQAAMTAYYKKHLCRLDPWPDYIREAVSGLNMDVYLSMWGPSEFTVTGTLKGYDLLPRLHEIKAPVLLTCGDRDEAGVNTVKRCQMLFPHAAMAVLPDSSHLHHLEKPALFLAITREFMSLHGR